MVYVLNKYGKPLMPTTRYGRVRRLLRKGLAVVVDYRPFTIQLNYDTPNGVQEVSLGVDAGSKHVGFSTTTKKKVLFEAELLLRSDIVEKLSTRREFRWARRNRKTRYRKSRFVNRTRTKKPGWIAPSVRQKVDCHIHWILKICKLLPIRNITVETAQFDTQLLKAQEQGLPLPHGTDYQKGEQLGFSNIREYVLFRDGHKCQCCKGKSKDNKLRVHHIESRKTGGDAPNNLITLCSECHAKYHRGEIKLLKNTNRGTSFRDAAVMGIMRKSVFVRLKELFGDIITCHETYGYITKHTRSKTGLPKEHVIDARCISGNPYAESDGHYWIIRKLRANNRQLHKASILKGGIQKNNQAPREVHGYRLMDSVVYAERPCFVNGRRQSGYFSLSDISGHVLSSSVNYKHLNLINHNNSNIMEEAVISSPAKDG
ncbi:MAG: HNH endonuclease [Fibrobacter sp.]|nr:HNH endonuclease [Fibrobacter sp.]